MQGIGDGYFFMGYLSNLFSTTTDIALVKASGDAEGMISQVELSFFERRLGFYNISGRHLAAKLNVAASTLNRILKLQSGVSPEMALRLSKALGRSPESWLAMQDAYDLWEAKKRVKLSDVEKVNLDAA